MKQYMANNTDNAMAGLLLVLSLALMLGYWSLAAQLSAATQAHCNVAGTPATRLVDVDGVSFKIQAGDDDTCLVTGSVTGQLELADRTPVSLSAAGSDYSVDGGVWTPKPRMFTSVAGRPIEILGGQFYIIFIFGGLAALVARRLVMDDDVKASLLYPITIFASLFMLEMLLLTRLPAIEMWGESSVNAINMMWAICTLAVVMVLLASIYHSVRSVSVYHEITYLVMLAFLLYHLVGHVAEYNAYYDSLRGVRGDVMVTIVYLVLPMGAILAPIFSPTVTSFIRRNT